MKFNNLKYSIVLTAIFSSSLFCNREEALQQLEELSQKEWNQCSYKNLSYDFLAVFNEKCLEKFREFHSHLESLDAFNPSSLLILDGKIEYLLPMLFLLRLQKNFRYYGICLGNLNKTSRGMDAFSTTWDSSFSTFSDIKKVLTEYACGETIIIGLEREESFNDIETYNTEEKRFNVLGKDAETVYNHEAEIHTRLTALTNILKHYSPEKIIVVTRLLKPTHGLCGGKEKGEKYYHSEEWISRQKEELEINSDPDFFVFQLKSICPNIEVHSFWNSKKQYKTEKKEAEWLLLNRIKEQSEEQLSLLTQLENHLQNSLAITIRAQQTEETSQNKNDTNQ